MPKFKKRPITVEAVQWRGDNFDEIEAFTSAPIEQRPLTDKLFIPTLEGTMRAKVGDWIVRGVRGEVWPVEESIFPETYDEVIENAPQPLAYRWPWSRYKNFWCWLRYDLLIHWRCADCGKRHLSTPKGWSKHIGYDVPLCAACEDKVDRDYNAYCEREMAERRRWAASASDNGWTVPWIG